MAYLGDLGLQVERLPGRLSLVRLPDEERDCDRRHRQREWRGGELLASTHACRRAQ